MSVHQMISYVLHEAFTVTVTVDDLSLHGTKLEHAWSGHFSVYINSEECSKRFHEAANGSLLSKAQAFCVPFQLHIPDPRMPPALSANLTLFSSTNCQKTNIKMEKISQFAKLAEN